MAGSPGAADAMNIVLGDHGQVEIDDERQLRNVETTRGNVRGHQHPHSTRLEVVERAITSALALVAVKDTGANTAVSEIFTDAIGTALGSAEHQRLRFAIPQDLGERVALAIHRDMLHVV